MKCSAIIRKACLAAATSAMITAHAQLLYTAEILEPPPGTTSISGSRINNNGLVVGTASYKIKKGYYDEVAFLLQPDGQMMSLRPLDGHTTSMALGISDAGIVCGISMLRQEIGGERRAVWWESTATGYEACDWNDLRPQDLADILFDYFRSISADGRYIILGTLDPAGKQGSALLEVLYVGGHPTELQTVELIDGPAIEIRHDSSGVLRMLGAVAGQSFFWRSEPGQASPSVVGLGTVARGLNNQGELVGGSNPALYWTEADLRSGNLEAAELGGFSGGSASTAEKVNDLGQIVGSARTAGRRGEDRAVLWQDGVMVDLNSVTSLPSGVLLTRAYQLSDTGQILAQATLKGAYSLVLLTPIP